jgi:hypothetical protein
MYMNSSKLADWSEIVSSVAIVVTLIYLTIEVGQNVDAMRAQTRESVASGALAELAAAQENPNLIKSIITSEPLTAKEQIQLHLWIATLMRNREFAWLQHQAGIIDERQWGTELAILKGTLTHPRLRVWWNKIGRSAMDEAFVGFVDEVLEQTPASSGFFEVQANWVN